MNKRYLQRIQILKMRSMGWTFKEIGDYVGITKQAAQQSYNNAVQSEIDIKEYDVIGVPNKIKLTKPPKPNKIPRVFLSDEERKDKAALNYKKYVVTIRDRIVEYLGGKCKRCGFYDKRALQIDHVNGGGVREIKEQGGSVAMYKRIYVRIQAGENIKDYQLLCANCNWIKRHENHEVRGKV